MTKVIVTYSNYNPNDLKMKEKEFIINPDIKYKEVDDFVNLHVRSKYIPGFHLMNTVTTEFIDVDGTFKLTNSLDDEYDLHHYLVSYFSRKASEKHIKDK